MTHQPPRSDRSIAIDVDSPFWALTAPPAPSTTPLREDAAVDVVVVGAGLLGLSTAIHLAESGARVAVVEAHEPGAGSSGRNTGFVIPNFPSPLGPAAAIDAFGVEAGEWLVSNVGGAADFLFRLTERLGIACEQDQIGWAQAAHADEMLNGLESIAKGWQAHGFPIELLDADATAALLGFTRYRGCMMFRRGGQLNPLAYVRGLANAAIDLGVALYTRSPVLGTERSGPDWVVRTPLAHLRAGQVVLTLNVATDGLINLGHAPLRISHMRQTATAPLPPTSPYKGPSLPFSDTAPHPNFALRTTRDGRLVTGGDPELAHRRLTGLLPPGQSIEIAYTWGGDTAHTADLLPRFEEPAPGLFSAIGCNGRGVAMASMMGALVAEHLSDPLRSKGLLLRLGRPVRGF
ncbi:NAD(P)/FAD-dependent oxidoreductase [Lichenifustis flavocetrariae]|uniref:FAD-binding oxidoreductase n=1 Tax=Lichenifustis flavocetrariae TaxID=2949735 RepID=A0AA41Z370_9HYPH|nr:FAD-binding oxidoreductase [Lichenifustis flavocetrariae]MCW6512172.1 FAD-binding oxidoreductase [Lichenifustis flavocetrariae]